MEYRAWGTTGRPLVILLHALGCHSGWWSWVAPLLADQYRVIAPDFRGHGDSPRADDYRFTAYAADVEQLVRKLGADSCALVGHSMGGYVALTVAARSVIETAAVVVADMKTDAPDQELAELKAAAQRPSRIYPTLDEAVARYRLAPPDHSVPPERLGAVARECYRQLPDGTWTEKFDRRALAIEALAPLDLATRLSCPSLFLRGEHSVVMPAGPATDLAAAAGAPLITMPGLYHHLPLESPANFAAKITALLAKD